jgi:ABC-type nitrate/sulfonate/bicarbonate transport system substrate-binding protein
VSGERVIRLGTFTPSVLLEVTRRTGALAAAGLDVVEVAVASSPAQFRSLVGGDLDAALTSPDNVLGYHFTAANPLGQRVALRVDAAIDRGLGLSLWARPGLDTGALSGVTLGVDVATSGFAFVATALLARRALPPGSYAVCEIGSTPARATALLEGRCDVTILNAGNQLRARDAGAQHLGDVTELGPYLGTVLVGLAERDPTDRQLLAEALLSTAREIIAGHHVDTVADAARDRLGLDGPQAGEYRTILLDPASGLVATGQVEARAVRTLLALRHEAGRDGGLDGVEAGLGGLVATGRLVD